MKHLEVSIQKQETSVRSLLYAQPLFANQRHDNCTNTVKLIITIDYYIV